jgi:predicted permease
MTSLSFNRGFHRLLLFMTLGWALFCTVLFPLKMQWDGQQEALSQHYKDIKMCQQLMVERPEWEMTKNCYERIDANEKNTLALYSFKNFWVWDVSFWRVEILAVILPPLFVYGLAALFRWVVAGFAATAK